MIFRISLSNCISFRSPRIFMWFCCPFVGWECGFGGWWCCARFIRWIAVFYVRFRIGLDVGCCVIWVLLLCFLCCRRRIVVVIFIFCSNVRALRFYSNRRVSFFKLNLKLCKIYLSSSCASTDISFSWWSSSDFLLSCPFCQEAFSSFMPTCFHERCVLKTKPIISD